MLACLLSALLGIASRNIEQYSVPEKLSTLDKCAISALAQDSRGALWMTTAQGLFRYDGAELVCVDESARETPLCSCGDGICYGNPSGIVGLSASGTVKYASGWAFNTRESIIVGDGGRLVVCSGHRILEADGDSLAVAAVTGVQSGRISAAGFHLGELIVGTTSGYVFKLEGESLVNLYRCPSGVSSFFTDSLSRLWIGLSEGGVLRSDGLDFSEVKTSVGDTPRDVRCFCPAGRDGKIFLGSVDGLYSTDGNMKIVRDAEHAPSGHAIKSLLLDADGTVWVGTYYSGVMMFNPASPVRYIYGSHDYAQLVNAIVADDCGRVWMVTDHYGLFVQDKSERRLIPGTTDRKFKSAVWKSGSLWVGEYMGGLCEYFPGADKWKRYDYVDGQGDILPLSTYAASVSGDEIYLGTNSGLYVFDPSRETSITRKVRGLERKTIYSLDTGRDGTLWIGTIGLFSCSADGVLDSVEELEGEKCRCVDASGSRVIASVLGKGFCSLGGDGVSWFLASECGMSSDEVYAIRSVGDTVTVAGTSEGLSFVRMADGSCINCDSPLWVDTGTFLDGCISALPDGRLWAGGADGIVEIIPSEIDFDINEHPLVFDRLELNGEDCSHMLSSETIRIPHRLNDVTLCLSDFNLAGMRFADNIVCSEEFNIHESGVKSSYKLNFKALKRGVYSISVSSRALPSEICSVNSQDEYGFSLPGTVPQPPWRAMPCFFFWLRLSPSSIIAIRKR